MNKIIVLVGVSASGKSTYAKEYVKDNTNTVIISRDSLRLALFGFNEETYSTYYQGDTTEREKVVTTFFDSQVWVALEQGFDVIVDNTHLNKNYINKYKMYGVPIQLCVFDVSKDVCIQRDFTRTKSVGGDVVCNQYKQYTKLMETDFREDVDAYNNELQAIYESCKKADYVFSKPNCVVFDLDGTLAHSNGNRSPYDYTKVRNDGVDFDLLEMIDDLHEETDVIICTGRDAICYEDTKIWLNDNLIRHSGLFMRGQGDTRKDNIVKAELWKKIQEKYNIIGIFEDRKRVVNMARNLGFKCLQVDKGDF